MVSASLLAHLHNHRDPAPRVRKGWLEPLPWAVSDMITRRPSSRRTDDRRAGTHPAGIGKLGTRLLELAENVIYAGIATFLVRTALVCLALAGLDLPDILLVVIVVELLFAVRSTVEKR